MLKIIRLNLASLVIILLFSMIIGFIIKLLLDAYSNSTDVFPFLISIVVISSMIVVIVRGNIRKHKGAR